MLDLKSTTLEKKTIKFAPTANSTKPAKLDGAPVVSIVSGGATAQQATPEELEQGIAGYVISEDTPGSSVYKVTGDADLGEGVVTLEDGGTYTYSDPNADNLGLTEGVAVPK